jgi:DNA replicative helicase MCM subunit Mcm2 (Cdc46/Mcm family)
MTDRHAGYVVTLANDIREDDAEAVIGALRMVKGVLSVDPITGSFDVHIAEQRVRAELRDKLLGILREI